MGRTVSSAVTYSVTVIRENGCTATKSVPITEEKTIPVAGISTSANHTNAGQSVTLTASGGTQFLWSTGTTTAQIHVQAVVTTSYSVTVTSDNGCSSQASGRIIVNTLLQVAGPAKLCMKVTPPENAVVTLPVTMTVTGGSSSYSYSWSYKAPNSTKHKEIPSGGTVIGKIKLVPALGTATLNLIGTKGNPNGLQGYLIRLTVKDNTNTSSAQTLLDGTCPLPASSIATARQGIVTTEQVWVRVHPNPVAEVLQVTISSLRQTAKVTLFDLQGRQHGQWSVEALGGSGQVKAPVAELVQGLYSNIYRSNTERGGEVLPSFCF